MKLADTSVVVFLGPSAPCRDAKQVLPDARFCAPARMGDVYMVAAELKPSAIALIDGVFEQTPAVWHKEILFALSQGIRVYGGASMGALRAAELSDYGMIGVGAIFEKFDSGQWEDDDEVAVAHAQSDGEYRVLSEAMANIRFGLQAARERGLVSETTEQALLSRAKRIYYLERSWSALFASASEIGIDENERVRLQDFVRETKPNQKQDDALSVLRRVARDLSDSHSCRQRPVDFDFEPTFFWHRMVAWVRESRHQTKMAAHKPALQPRPITAKPQIGSSLELALLWYLVEDRVRSVGRSLTDQERKTLIERLRYSMDLVAGKDMEKWVNDNRLTEMDVEYLSVVDQVIESLCTRLQHDADRFGELHELVLKRHNNWSD